MPRHNVCRSRPRVWMVFSALLAAVLSGCAGVVDRAADRFGDDLEAAILDYTEPETIRQALPAYLVLLEARLQSQPDDAALRLTTARLTTIYTVLFVDQPERVGRLSERALEHARTGVCRRRDSHLCEIVLEHDPARLAALLEGLGPDDVADGYILAASWAGWVDAHGDDHRVLADLPRVEALFKRLGELSPQHQGGAIWLYLGVLNSQRPPAAGGRPDRALIYFERAQAVAGGANLLVPVLMADHYARRVFDRTLFNRLLTGVLAAETDYPGLTLINLVARARAIELLEMENKIFE